MKWLTIADIKKQLRLDFNDEDDVLELYGSAAEDTVLNYLNRTYQDVMEVYGHIPAPIRHATLMLVDVSYQYRSPVSPTNVSMVPYTFEEVQVTNYTLGSQFKILVDATLPDELTLQDVDFTVTVYNDDQKDQQKVYEKSECILTDDGNYVVLVNSDDLGVGTLMVKLVVMIPDTDFPGGARKEVIRINPNVKVTG